MGRGNQKNRLLLLLTVNGVLLILLATVVVVAVCVGKYAVTPAECLKVIWGAVSHTPSGCAPMTENVVLMLRLPRILASVLVGACLSVSGVAYQGVFQNPLIAPDFLGVSSGACIGAAVAILLSLGRGSTQLMAFLGGIVAVAITVLIPIAIRNNTNIMLVLSGVVVGAAASSVLGFIKFTADPESQLAAITYWTMGDFSYIQMDDILSVLPMMGVAGVVLTLNSWWLDVLSMGENQARSLGANVTLLRNITIVCATLLTAGSVCLAGTISWVGLVIPHLSRMIVGPNNTRLIPVSALMGGLFMLVVDTLTRTIGAIEMPVSILTGLIGAPFYIYLLIRNKRAGA
ncbi:MAG: iron ABC transporter permease [Clostridia bacterium]|nr:iron ABC transporter permease [Clostridia bacterium]